jgi:TonB family protein
MGFRVKRSYFSERDFRKNRVIAIVWGLLIHLGVVAVVYVMLTRHVENAATVAPDSLSFGASGGGGAEEANDAPVEFGPHHATQEDPLERKEKSAEVELIQIHILQPEVPVENAMPVPEKPKEKPKIVQKKSKPRPPIIASDLPIGHVRHGGQGPGSGGGMGGGSGGGIGARQGYAIDWGGSGGRQLLSGRIPEYPKGTDKQMLVVLNFVVLPDGTVKGITPARRSDELLERAAILALQTWRFDPLPSAVPQVDQSGKVTFNFKIE